MIYVILVILLVIVILTILRIRNLTASLNKQVEYTEELEEVLYQTTRKIDSTYKEVLIIDNLGLFQNNDHTGVMFKSLKESYEELVNYIIKINNEQEDKA